jgi:hypothetical protein
MTPGTRAVEDAMSQNPGETGAWWTEFPGSDKATWSAPRHHRPVVLHQHRTG